LTVFNSKPENTQIKFTILSARPLSPMMTLSLPATVTLAKAGSYLFFLAT